MNVVYRVNGVELTPEEFASRKKVGIDFTQRAPSYINREWEDHFCEGSAVHPKDVSAAEEHAKKNGIPTYFDKHGRPQYTSARHQAQYLRLIGMHNKDGVL